MARDAMTWAAALLIVAACALAAGVFGTDALPMAPPRPGVRLLLAAVDGMLVSIRADTGNVLWRIPSKSPFLSASHVDGIPIGASRDSQAGVILPGVDGNLFYMNGDAVRIIVPGGPVCAMMV